MKKLLAAIVLLLAPIVLYFAIFVAYEPNNYFGIKAQADGTDIIAILREYQKKPQERMILGDSRMAKLDMAVAKAACGKSFANLAFGGASLKEQLDLLEWAMNENKELKEVVFAISFYTLNQSYNHDRRVIECLNNPLAYITNLGYNINMLTNLYDHLATGRSVGHSGESMDPALYEYVQYEDFATGRSVAMRTKLAEHIENLLPRSRAWQLNQQQLNRLLAMAEECQERGISLVLVLPPAHSDVMQYVVGSCGISEGMKPALSAIEASGVRVLDYEFQNRDALSDDQFFDGFHLDEERGLIAWTEMLFSAI